jgi:hypothetical protein
MSITYHVKVSYISSTSASFIQQARFSALPSSLRSTLTASLTGTAPQRVHLECGPDEGDGQDRPPRGLRRPPPVGAAAWGLSALGAQLNKFHLDTRAALVVTVGRLLTARAGRRFLTKLNEDFKLIHFYNAA